MTKAHTVREFFRRIAEGPIIQADKGINDARPGLPTPNSRIPVSWQQPRATTSDVTLPQQLSPSAVWSKTGSVKVQIGLTGKPYPTAGASTTITLGFGKLNPQGTDIVDQKDKQRRRIQ